MTSRELRQLARDLYLDTIAKVRIEDALRASVRLSSSTLQVCDLTFDLDAMDDLLVIAMGKAAGPMYDTAMEPLLSSNKLRDKLRAIVVGPVAPRDNASLVQVFPGSHPLPDAHALRAAQAIRQALSRCSERSLVLFLISGGASAMIEEPLDSSLTWQDCVQFHRALIGSGLPITQMNALRKHVSRVKGGRLAVAAQGAMQCSLLISDVPEGSLHVIASGPSLPDPTTIHDCRAIVNANTQALLFPERVFSFFRSPDLAETPKEDHPAFQRAHWRSLLSSDDLSRYASAFAEAGGFHVVVDNTCDDWAYAEAAEYLIERMQQLQKVSSRVCLISVGELSVVLPREHGTGGRNQQFVLECARILAERNLPFTVLSAGSDGIDGNSPAAGAVADRETVARAQASHFDVSASLQKFDSFPLLQALDDVVITGPTGTNVRDVRLLLSDSTSCD